ncbi:LacI family DNA-binding transcriptional regulator [Pseudolysinimonas sp.]|uniref:LacI family DNA-binding transcriptional regulator n=1 Tax=Pseudolysinimonas sp. TaxID=2680009 RepID=UPI003F80A6C4
MATRDDVAQLAGVSPRTVTNVMNGAAAVSEATRQRVLEAVARVGYRPSEIGRMLRSGRTGILVAVLPGVDAPYFAELARCLTDAARVRGYSLLIEQSDGERDRELELLARADRKAFFDGLVISPLALRDEDLLRTTRTERPVVLLGEERHPGFDHVAIDNLAAARAATEHLLARGRRRLVAVGAQREQHSSSALRLAGFEAAIADASAGVETAVEYVDAFSRAAGAAAARRILARDELPDALFCFSDLLAVGAMSVLGDAGVAIPEQIAVMGFNGSDEARYTRPAMSTVTPDKRAIAEAALDALVRRIDGDDGPSRSIAIPYEVTVRGSS